MLNLVTTIDVEWLPYACMMLESVRRVQPGDISCWIVHENIIPELIKRSQDWAKKREIDLWFVHFDELGMALPHSSLYTRASMYGRYLPKHFLPASVTRCLYLDVDILVLKPLDPLMTTDLKGHPFGAVHLHCPAAAAEIGVESLCYFNNGVLLIDVPAFPGQEYVRKMDALMSVRKLIFGPQSAFNMVARGQALLLDPVWNVQGEMRRKVQQDAAIIHFTGSVKPWHCLSPDPLRAQVRDMMLSTPFPEAWEPDRNVLNWLRRWKKTASDLIRCQ